MVMLFDLPDNDTLYAALLVPCHRVIGADGALTGYGGGLWRKQKLIEIERRHAQRSTAPTLCTGGTMQ